MTPNEAWLTMTRYAPKPEQERLEHHAEDLADARIGAGALHHGLMARLVGAVDRRPSAPPSRLPMPRARITSALRRPASIIGEALAALGRGVLGRLPHRHVGEQRQEEDDDRAADHRVADQRVDQEADDDLDRQERQVGEGRRAAAGDEGADLVEVAERLQPVAGERVPERQGDDGAEDLGVDDLVDIGADADQDAGPHLVEEAEGAVQERHDRREAEEGRRCSGSGLPGRRSAA